MRNYSVVEYPQKRDKYFSYLINEYNFKIIENKKLEFGFLIEYVKNDIRVHLHSEFYNDFYYFSII